METIIISVCSEKGGVGKTTTTHNIAGALNKLGKRVIVIDLDQQMNISQTLGYIRDGKPTIADLIYNTVAGNKVDIETAIRHSENGIDYIPASPMLTNITSIISNDVDANYVLKRAIEPLKEKNYDFILLDCRTLLDLFVSNAMNTSDYIVIPVESGIYAYNGLDKMVDKVKSVNNSTNSKLKILGILLNKKQNTSVYKAVAEAAQKEYTELTFQTVIPYCPAQAENAVINQKSCAETERSSMGNAFMSLINEMIERIGANAT